MMKQRKQRLEMWAVAMAAALLLAGCSAGMSGASEALTSEAPAVDVPDSAAPEVYGEEEIAPEAEPEAGASYAMDTDRAPANGGVPQEFKSSGEQYLTIDENRRKSVAEEQMLTFSLKVDTAAYTNVARYIESGNLPPADAVRTEELLNYFRYDGKMTFGGDPFAISTEVGPSPFDASKSMALVRVKSREIDRETLPRSNLTFLIDTSGSMDSFDKLPLLKTAFELLVETLDEDDKVSIVTYAGSSAVVLDSVTGDNKEQILRAINDLSAGGSTAGADGIQTAYALAEKNFMEGGNNRVLLATDGDFNVGLSSTDALAELVGEKRENGVYLSILGFGTGNTRDDIMETLSKNGNGNYAYIHSVADAKKVLVDELATNLFTIADDVKAQVEFNPDRVKSYRLLGYENRSLENEDFADDSKDAGEIGVGTDVVVMFELELWGDSEEREDGLKYGGSPAPITDGVYGEELFEVRIRYKNPGEGESKLMTHPVSEKDIARSTSADYNFACSVVAFAHLLRGSEYAGEIGIDEIIAMAKGNLGKDPEGYRQEHVLLLREYKRLAG